MQCSETRGVNLGSTLRGWDLPLSREVQAHVCMYWEKRRNIEKIVKEKKRLIKVSKGAKNFGKSSKNSRKKKKSTRTLKTQEKHWNRNKNLQQSNKNLKKGTTTSEKVHLDLIIPSVNYAYEWNTNKVHIRSPYSAIENCWSDLLSHQHLVKCHLVVVHHYHKWHIFNYVTWLFNDIFIYISIKTGGNKLNQHWMLGYLH